jgi:hypothetical protein
VFDGGMNVCLRIHHPAQMILDPYFLCSSVCVMCVCVCMCVYVCVVCVYVCVCVVYVCVCVCPIMLSRLS